MKYITLDKDDRIVGIGDATNPLDVENLQRHHGKAFEVLPNNVHPEPGAKYDRKNKKVTEPPTPKAMALPPELEKALTMPPLEEFVEAFYRERRGDPEPMEEYLRKRDEVERKFRAG